MKIHFFRSAAIAALGVSFLFLGGNARAQVMTSNASGVNAYFASQSEAYKDSDPTGATWGLAGIGPYSFGAGIPSLPATPAPSISPPVGNGFSGGGWTSLFNDGLSTTAKSTIADSYLTTPTQTADAFITFPTWNVTQNAAAIGFAYEQVNFASNYLIQSNPGLAASPSPSLPISVSGQVISPGTYAEFNADIVYTWLPVTVSVNTAGTISLTPNGPSTALGTLSYTFIQPSGGTFTATVPSSGSLLATPSGDGILALTGEAWIAGDPFDLTATPEPSAFMLMGVAGLMALKGRRTRLA
jgi:hypothetical protein